MGMLHRVEEVWMKNIPYDELIGEWDMHSAGDLVICLGYFNGYIDGVNRVYGMA